MSRRDEDDVDAFGRVVPGKGAKSSEVIHSSKSKGLPLYDNNNHGTNRRQEFPNNKQNYQQPTKSFANRDYGNRDYQSHNRDFNSSKRGILEGDYRDDRRQDWGSRDRSPPRHSAQHNYDYNGSHQTRFGDRQSSPRRHVESAHRDPHHQQQPLTVPTNNRITPIMSFKSFMQTQLEDLAPEVFQRKYEEYHVHYLGDFSKSFFRASVGEEWFQDRYNPVCIQALEKEAVQWAAKESAEFGKLLVDSPLETVRSVCLDPQHAQPPNRRVSKTVEDSSVTNTADSSQMIAIVDEQKDSNAALSSVSRSSAKHFSGHEDRTLYLSGIHACCTKAVLRNAICDAIAKTGDQNDAIPNEADGGVATTILAPERILIAQPVWSKVVLEKFERTAWVVMPTPQSARQALSVLKELVVDVPGPVDVETGERRPLFSFTLNAAFHVPKLTHFVPDIMSHPVRVEADTQRALQLCELLDEDRLVPADQRLATLLENNDVVAAFEKPTDKLDVVIAYLRRVHFVAFYGGKRFRDEAHLLSMSASIVFRSKPCQVQTLNSTTSINDENSDSDVISNKRKRRGSDDGNDDDEGEDGMKVDEEDKDGARDTTEGGDNEANPEEVTDVAVKIAEDGEESDTVVKPVAATTAVAPTSQSVITQNGRNFHISDRRVDAMISDLRAKRDLAAANADKEEKLGLTPDEIDAAALLAKQEKTYMQCVERQCKLEKEGKARCCYGYCNKLFKDLDFLSKHIKTKHEDFALDLLLELAEPYMLQRFEAEDISARPLPPVEVEVHGVIELKSVKEILEKCQSLTGSSSHPHQHGSGRDGHHRGNVGRDHGGRFDHRNDHDSSHRGGGGGDRRWSGGGGGRGGGDGQQSHVGGRRGHDDRDRRATIGGSRPQQSEQQQRQYVEPRPEDNFARKISSYLDVDAPKESAVSIDYGVALLPPVKRRKLLVKKDVVTPTAVPVVDATVE